MKIAVLPKDANPYQDCLYAEMARLGDVVCYVGQLTRSQTLDVLLLPFELIWLRLRGGSVLHIHWVYRFSLPGQIAGTGFLRRLLRMWFHVVLLTARMVGLRVVWVAHNVLPHERVFDDDVAGRRTLLQAADVVVAHGEEVLEQLAALGPLPPTKRAVRHPAYSVSYVAPSRAVGRPIRLLYFGSIARYKGVLDLVRAVGQSTAKLELMVAGACADTALKMELLKFAAISGSSIGLRLQRLDDEELETAVAGCDLVVLPFEKVTTSGSVLYALSAGRPVLMPVMPTLAGLPDAAVIRYVREPDPVAGLADALSRLASQSDELVARGRAGREWAQTYTWTDLAAVLHDVSNGQPHKDKFTVSSPL